MKLINSKIKNGPKMIRSVIHKDSRGFLKETFKNSLFRNKLFPFDIMSFSKKNVLRGFHLQLKNPQSKIITVTYGKIFDVAVDLRKNSKTFGQHVSIEISHTDDFSFFIPEGFAHGFLCLSKICTVNYKCSNYRDANSERTLMWNDKSLKIKWPIKKPILSKKDRNGLALKDFY
tara:strand:- start:8212 stop:8733 length:522 start_codon:yes stop_codon:yes gene_type:complete